MGKALRLSVNERGILANLKLAFAGKESIVLELVQNARRAGATQVQVDIEAIADYKSTVRIIDDGCGVDDMQKLFCAALSGWDEQTKLTETPYGLGFLSTLFAARRIRVESGDRFVVIDTDKVIALDDFHDAPLPVPRKGTMVELWEVDIPAGSLQQRLKHIAKGYSLPIVLNGSLLPNPHALNQLNDLIETPIGYMELAKSPENLASFICYLQGAEILRSEGYWYGGKEDHTIIHLAPSKFFGRWPDRDTLHEANESRGMIERVLASTIREHLKQLMQTLPEVEFACTCWNIAMRVKAYDLLNELSVVPADLFHAIDDLPHLANDHSPFHEQQNRGSDPKVLRRTDVERGNFVIIADGSYLTNAEEMEIGQDAAREYNRGHAAGLWAYLHRAQELVGKLPKGHWLHNHVFDGTDACFEVQFVEPGAEAHFVGSWISCFVRLVDHIVIRLGDVAIAVDDEALFQDGIAYIPAKCRYFATVLYRLSSYTGEFENYEEADFDSDLEILTSLVMGLRGAKPEEILERVLGESEWRSQPCLANVDVVMKSVTTGTRYDDASLYCLDMNHVIDQLGHRLGLQEGVLLKHYQDVMCEALEAKVREPAVLEQLYPTKPN